MPNNPFFSLPRSLLEGLAGLISEGPSPPQWMVQEMQQRLVLLLNHVLMQEAAATARLKPRSGRVVRVQWRQFSVSLKVTPAGLFDLTQSAAAPDLHFEVSEPSALAIAQAAVGGDRPPVRIDGDVEFAGDLQWLVDNLRWDIEDDLARVMGDVPAHTLANAARSAAAALRSFVGKGRARASSDMAPWSGSGPLP